MGYRPKVQTALSPLRGLIDHTAGSSFINGPHPSASPGMEEEGKPTTGKCHSVEEMKGAGALQKVCVCQKVKAFIFPLVQTVLAVFNILKQLS